jgi:hypothetical protein
MQKLYTPHQVLAASTLTANVLFAALQAALRFKIAPGEFVNHSATSPNSIVYVMQKLYTPHQVLAASTLTANVLFAAADSVHPAPHPTGALRASKSLPAIL